MQCAEDSFVCSWWRPKGWNGLHAIMVVVIGSGMYLFTIKSPLSSKLTMSLYDNTIVCRRDLPIRPWDVGLRLNPLATTNLIMGCPLRTSQITHITRSTFPQFGTEIRILFVRRITLTPSWLYICTILPFTRAVHPSKSASICWHTPLLSSARTPILLMIFPSDALIIGEYKAFTETQVSEMRLKCWLASPCTS